MDGELTYKLESRIIRGMINFDRGGRMATYAQLKQIEQEKEIFNLKAENAELQKQLNQKTIHIAELAAHICAIVRETGRLSLPEKVHKAIKDAHRALERG